MEVRGRCYHVVLGREAADIAEHGGSGDIGYKASTGFRSTGQSSDGRNGGDEIKNLDRVRLGREVEDCWFESWNDMI